MKPVFLKGGSLGVVEQSLKLELVCRGFSDCCVKDVY